MNSLIEKYTKDHCRISIVSDYKSEYASDILFYGIRDVLEYNFPKPKSFLISESLHKLHVLDQYNINNGHIPFRVIVNNWYPNIKSEDSFLFRGIFVDSMSPKTSIIIPRKILYESDLVIQLVDNKMTIIKDRIGYENIVDMNIKPFLRNSKIKKIIKKIF